VQRANSVLAVVALSASVGLKPDGEKLSNVNADFNDVLNKNIPAQKKIQIYSFQEGKPISSVKFFDGKVNQCLQLK